MNRAFYLKLAAGNIRKNSRIYFPYMLTGSAAAAMYYIVSALSENSSVAKIGSGDTLVNFLNFCAGVTAVFLAVFLFYTNSFVIKRRKKEFGLYSILGMEKKHISKVVFWENTIIAAVCITAGLFFGIILNKLVFLLLLKILGSSVQMGFEISAEALVSSAVLFSAVFFLILIRSLVQVNLSSPLELLKSARAGEKPPKTNWPAAAAGLICLGTGYYTAVSIENPAAALGFFFIAVVLVMAGTYLTFSAGIIAFLRILSRNKKFYYKTKHFIPLSGMIYRMRQNAAGLANICILSAAVLVTVSTSLSLYAGAEDALNVRYPQSFVIRTREHNKQNLYTAVYEETEKRNLVPLKETAYTYVAFAAEYSDGEFTADPDMMSAASFGSARMLVFISLEDYNKSAGTNKVLGRNEVLMFSNMEEPDSRTFRIFGEKYTVKETIEKMPGAYSMAADIMTSHYIVTDSAETLDRIFKGQETAYGNNASPMFYIISFDLDAGSEEIVETYHSINDRVYNYADAECREEGREDFLLIHGGEFFIGIFLGLLFLIAMVLIIYYKQVSEGYDDSERFRIMQNIGMSRDEIRKAVNSQVLMVFFLPLITAGIHTLAAFPALSRILRLLSLYNTRLFAVCTASCFGVFCIFYCAVYFLTSRTYYRIVS